MEKEFLKLMTPFDCQTIPQWIYMLKLLLPYTPEKYQHTLAIFIRFQEMQFTLKHFKGFRNVKHLDNIINDVKPYMDSATQDMMEQMESVMSMLDMMQMMQEGTPDSSDGFNPMNMFSDLFSMKGNIDNE